MRKLYLHIGMHKTGTTSLQNFLERNRDMLTERGFLYPAGGFYKTRAWATHMRPGHPDLAQTHAYWKSHIGRHLDCQPDLDVIISYEGLWRLSIGKKQEQRAEMLKRCLEGFEVHVILYVRRQDLWFEAMHNQLVKTNKETRTLEDYIAQTQCHGMAKLWPRICFWRDHFGEERVNVRVYERSQLKNGDIIQDFLGLLGIEYAPESRPIHRMNPRMGGWALKAKAAFNHLDTSQPINRLVRDLLMVGQRVFPPESDAGMPLELARKILNEHQEDNSKVASYLLDRNDGRLFYDELPEDVPYDLKD